MHQYAVQARDVLTPDQLNSLKDIRMHDGRGKKGGKGRVGLRRG